MSDRTTINVPKSRHQNAAVIKDEYDETWGDVLAFYRYFRDEFPEKPRFDANVSVGGLDESEKSVEPVNEAALAEALADYLINGENLPQRVADELGGGRR